MQLISAGWKVGENGSSTAEVGRLKLNCTRMALKSQLHRAVGENATYLNYAGARLTSAFECSFQKNL
jgi:hypothetical protein